MNTLNFAVNLMWVPEDRIREPVKVGMILPKDTEIHSTFLGHVFVAVANGTAPGGEWDFGPYRVEEQANIFEIVEHGEEELTTPKGQEL